MAQILKTWKKNQTALYVNIARPTDAAPTPEADWARIGKSTIFALTFNANVVTYDFIEDENPTDIINNYKPTISEELRTVRGDKAFDAMFEYMYNTPTGDDAVRDALFVFPAIQAQGAAGAAPTYFAWLAKSSLVITNFNTVDEKILFDLNFAGDIVKGTVTTDVSTGMPVFTAFTDQMAWVPTADAAAPTGGSGGASASSFDLGDKNLRGKTAPTGDISE